LVPILDRLQGRELLVRRPSPTDGRTHALALTPLGTRTLAQFSRLVRSHERRIARGLSSDEMRLLIALLEKVRAGVSPL
jgi:DNA-binding MarR family transcriptional regulator